MWPILLLFSFQICLAVEINSPSSTINQPHFQFPPNFATTTLTPFTEKTIYLPPESQTAIPYHPILTANNLQYSYLPPTEHKVPEKYPPSYINYLKQNYEENMKKILRRESNDSDEEVENEESRSRPTQNSNQSRNDDISVRPLPKTFAVGSFQDRRDIKYPYYGSNQQQNSNMNAAPVRRTVPQPQNVIATVTEHPVPDQYKMASQVSNQYAPYHQGLTNQRPEIYQGTTEEPTQILRLSNEMDIDGTFRYETLTGDQTHIMQQGHIENIGTDNEEQVIEGSYSYVGDNGQTYTVHYIADGNGFRATGDHLPVPPPMPEIIQRSVEYNIMEESKRPQNQQLQNYPDLDSDLVSKIQHNRAQQQQQLGSHFPSPTPSRNHFTGRQPEAFSRPFPGAAPESNSNSNVQSASTVAPVVASPPKDAHFSATKLQPQITFMATQGAHVPKQETTTPSISRSYGFPPQEIQRIPNNFFLNRYLESNQIRQQQQPNVEIENHGLPWDFQRKLREMQMQEEHNKAVEEAKKSISRSSTDVEDDVLINFQDMNPQQYENIYYSHINPNSNQGQNNPTNIPLNHKTAYEPLRSPHIKSGLQMQEQQQENYPIYQNPMFYQQNQIPPQSQNKPHQTYSVENYPRNQNQNRFNNLNSNYNIQAPPKKYHNLITQNDFLPQSQTVTASYDYDTAEARNGDYESDTNLDSPKYEPKKILSESSQPIILDKQANLPQQTTERTVQQFEYIDEIIKVETTQPSTTPIHKEAPKLFESTTPVNLLAAENFNKQTSNPYSHISSQNGTATSSETSTIEESMKNLLETNFFLKNMNEKKNSEKKTEHTKKEIEKEQLKSHMKKEVKKENNNLQKSNVNQEEISKKVDISHLINFVNMKNMFESSKIVPKSTNQRQESYTKNDVKELPKQDLSHSKERMDRDSYITSNNGNNQYEDTELQKQIKGKVYKTLHRNNGNFKFDGTNLRTDLTPPKFTIITSQSANSRKGLPPLGRAGPNMKSYLPPVYT